MSHVPGEQASEAIDEDPYTMASLRPAFTGLPMVVWVSEGGNDVRVCCDHGMSHADLEAVVRWIALNEDAIIAYGDGTIDTAELVGRLRPLNPS